MRRFALILAALALAGAARADTLRLGEGRQVRGKILKETAEAFFVDLGFTVLVVPKKAVVARETEDQPAAEARANRAEGQLYSTIQREEKSVKGNVDRTASAVVMVQTPSGLGSGFVISPDGYLITNDHVVQGDTQITVVLFEKGQDGKLEKRKLEKAKIVAINAWVDLALLKIEGEKDLPIAYLGDSNELRQGQAVFAIGNPLGLERSVSEGIISTTNRAFEGLTYIQTTTQINPGNSGGPLFNLKGEVVGVTNMTIPSGEGLSFAIPVEEVKRFLANRDAFAYDKDNPNTGYRYLPPPLKKGAESPG